jgi:hypothetical protein
MLPERDSPAIAQSAKNVLKTNTFLPGSNRFKIMPSELRARPESTDGAVDCVDSSRLKRTLVLDIRDGVAEVDLANGRMRAAAPPTNALLKQPAHPGLAEPRQFQS